MTRRPCWLLATVLLASGSALAHEPFQILSAPQIAEDFATRLDQPSFGPWFGRVSQGVAARIREIALAPHVESMSLGTDTWVGMSRDVHHVEITLRKGGEQTATLYADGSAHIADGATTVELSTSQHHDLAKARPLRILGRPAALVWEQSANATQPGEGFSRARLYVGARAGFQVRVPQRLVRNVFKTR